MSSKRTPPFLPLILLLSGTVIACVAVYLAFIRPSTRPEATYHLAWSPDGNHVAFECVFFSLEERKRQLREFPEPYHDVPNREICVADISRDVYVRLDPLELGFNPSWSPDGRQLAWFSPPRSIRVWDRVSTTITNYVSAVDLDFSDGRGDRLSWDSGGGTILLQGPGFAIDLSSGSYDTSLPAEDGLDQCCFTRSPDGEYLAFLSNERLLVYAGYTQVFRSNTTAAPPFSWSSDGETLAWSKGGWYENELALTHVPTSATYFFDSDEVSLRYPVWSSDGSSLAAIGYRAIHILSLDLQGITPPAHITRDTVFDASDIHVFSGVALSPNGRSIAYDSEQFSIVILDTAGSRHTLKEILPSISRRASPSLDE